jgi:hypothetical protein
MRAQDLLAKFLKPIETARADRQVVTLGGELPGHLRAEAGASSGDEDALTEQGISPFGQWLSNGQP